MAFPFLDTANELVTGLTDTISGKRGYDTAAQGARDAQKQANYLSDLQWQRQMQGLQEARGQTQPYLSLYDKIYNTQTAGRAAPVGGLGVGGPRGGAGMAGMSNMPGGGSGPDPYAGRGAVPGGGPTPIAPGHSGLSMFDAIRFRDSKPVYAPVVQGGPPSGQAAQMPTTQALTMAPAPQQQPSNPALQQLLENIMRGRV